MKRRLISIKYTMNFEFQQILPHAAAPRSVGHRAEVAAGAHRIRISGSGPGGRVPVSRWVGAPIPADDDKGHGF